MKPRRIPGLREPAAVYLPDAFVIDCSVCVPWYLRDEASQFCDQLGLAVHRSEAWVPSLWRAELVSAMVNAERRKRLTAQQRTDVLRNAADRITAGCVRRVIKGYAFSGTQREELLREK